MFEQQVTNEVYIADLLYLIGVAASFLAVLGIAMVDFGVVRAKNGVDTLVQKLIASLVGGFAFALVGYGVWEWQLATALGVPNAFSESVGNWWIGGEFLTKFAQDIDPEIAPSADVAQVFVGFFIGYAAFVIALVHSAGIERLKPLPMFVMAVLIGGVFLPLLTYLTWGPTGPLSNEGVHDFVGQLSGYVFVGVWALVLVWRLGPRLGAFDSDPRTEGPRGHSLGMTAVGVGLLLVAIPLFALGSGFLFPGQGYFGIHMTESGFGIVTVNSVAALALGGLGGALLGYRTRNAFWILVGPIAGFVACAGLIDIAKPWSTSLVAFFAPFVAYVVERWLHRHRIDEHKIIPLGLGCGAYGAILTGFVGWGVKAGGFPGGKEGYELQHAEITPWWQLIGLGATIAFTLVAATITILALEKTVGLRVSEEDEIGGLDEGYWPSGESLETPSAPTPSPGRAPVQPAT